MSQQESQHGFGLGKDHPSYSAEGELKGLNTESGVHAEGLV